MASPRRLTILAAVALAVGVGVPVALGGGSLSDRQADVIAKIDDLKVTVQTARKREKVLTSDLAAAREQIELVEEQLVREEETLGRLSERLESSQQRLERLRGEVADATRLLELQRGQERIAQERLEERLVELYKTEPADAVTEILLRVGDLGEVLNELDYLGRIAENDEKIVADVDASRRQTAATRKRAARLQRDVARATATLSDQTERQRELRDGVVSREQDLLAAQGDREALLGQVRSSREDAQEHIEDLEEASKRLARKIAALARTSSSGVSSGSGARPASGFIWPVSGPLTSGFGWRWGRMHEGIDIGVGFGVKIYAVAAGTVVYAGWMGGYGNLVLIDHGDGVSTAYAHQQQIYVANGQRLGQGEAIGEVGSTGNSTGPHLHFEVRVNGAAVDPLGYL